eukprot:6491682-Amphidinium_carterae.1
MSPKLGKLAESLSPKKKKQAEQKRCQHNRRDIDEQVDRALQHHFPDFTSVETDGRLNCDGKSLRQVMTEERKSASAKANFRYGQKFIAEQRTTFASEHHVSKVLQVKNPNDRLSDELVACLAAASSKDRTKRKKEPLYAVSPNMHKSHPERGGWAAASLPRGRDHLLKVVSELVQRDIHIQYGDECRLLAGHFDGMLAAHFAGAKKQRMASKTWWETFGHLTQLLPEHAIFQRLMSHEGAAADVADDIAHVTSQSKLGALLFGNTQKSFALRVCPRTRWRSSSQNRIDTHPEPCSAEENVVACRAP